MHPQRSDRTEGGQRLAACTNGAAQLCAACRAGGADRRQLGLSPARHLWRVCRVRAATQPPRSRLAVGRGHDRPDPGFARNDRAGPSRAIHRRDDARGRGARRGTALRSGDRHRAICRTCYRRRGRWRDCRRRCGGYRDGAVVDPRRPVAAAAGGVRPEGPQPRLRHRHGGSEPGRVSRIPGAQWRGAVTRAVSARRRHDLYLRHSPAKSHCRSTRLRLRRSRARSNASKRCARRCRRHSPRRRSWHGRRASAR